MNRQLQFTRKMFDLQTIGEGEQYPRISALWCEESIGDALVRLVRTGYQLRTIVPPWQIACYKIDESSHAFYHRDVILLSSVDHVSPDPEIMCYKLRFVFVLERDYIPGVKFVGDGWEWTEKRLEREFVKGGFLYDSPEQLDEWLEARKQ